jgi:hypothetical protein
MVVLCGNHDADDTVAPRDLDGFTLNSVYQLTKSSFCLVGRKGLHAGSLPSTGPLEPVYTNRSIRSICANRSIGKEPLNTQVPHGEITRSFHGCEGNAETIFIAWGAIRADLS